MVKTPILFVGLIYIRGNVQGYDLMASRVGDSIWNTQNIMQFYKKVENYNGWFKKGSWKYLLLFFHRNSYINLVNKFGICIFHFFVNRVSWNER